MELKTMWDLKKEAVENANKRNAIIKGDSKGDYMIYQRTIEELYTKVKPLRHALINAYEDVKDATGMRGTTKLRRVIMALGGFK